MGFWGESEKEKLNRVAEEDRGHMFSKKRCSGFLCSNITEGSDDKCPACLRKEHDGKKGPFSR